MKSVPTDLIFYPTAVVYSLWLSKYGFLYYFASRTEPDYFPLAMLMGPMSMLPALLVSFFFRRMAAIWLGLGSVLGAAGVVASNVWALERVLEFVALTSVPMLASAAYLYSTARLRRVSRVMK
jgi:hypothetical protein